MEDLGDESLNASQILHLALQKMDGIIAVTSDSDTTSLTSSENISQTHRDSFSLPSNGTIKAKAIDNTNGNGHHLDSYSLESHIKNINKTNNQDKLNRLLAELKEYSREDEDMAALADDDHFLDKQEDEEALSMPQLSHELNGNTILENANNNNLDSSTTKQMPGATSEAAPDARSKAPPQASSNNNNNAKTCSSDYFSSSTIELQKQQQEREELLDHHHLHQQQQQRCDPLVDVLRNQLLNTEDLFKKALLSKKTLESANQNLLTVVEKLKLELAHSETRRKLGDENRMKLELDNEQIQTKLLEKETEISSLRLTLAKIARSTGYPLSSNELELLRGNTIASDFIKNKYLNYAEVSPKIMSTSVPAGAASAVFYSEPSSRRESYSSRACSPPMAPRFYSNQPSPASTPPARATLHQANKNVSKPSPLTACEDNQTSNVIRSSSVENMKTICDTNGQEKVSAETQLLQQRLAKNAYSTLPHSTKSLRAVKKALKEEKIHDKRQAEAMLSSPQKLPIGSPPVPSRGVMLMSNAGSSTPSSPLNVFKSSAHQLGSGQQQASPHHHHHHTNGVTFGKRFFLLRRNKRTTSAPELAKDDELIPLPASLQSSQVELQRDGETPPRTFSEPKPKGLRRIFSRKRSTTSLSDAFSRGGVRATSGARFAQASSEKRFENISIPFSQWDNNLVAEWLATIGLGMYVGEWRNWKRNGGHLMRATSAEVEKDFGVRNSLHRKKLRLAVAAMNDDEDELLKNAGRLDYLWVARWLDDIGLPQYKDAFIDARVDGRVLHYLTVEDLFNLKVTSQLHFASIRSGIRILRDNKYNNQCLKRRANPDEANQTSWSPGEVSLWSSHRVMEWLRSIDLSEYAPNLRGSGVHGALVLFESAFNSDLFATLLSIPTSKTLLRRHISTKFKQLIGEELHRIKHNHECQPQYQPMMPGSKVKAYKKGHFSLRKKRSDYELTDYVCPLVPTQTIINNLAKHNRHELGDESPITNRVNANGLLAKDTTEESKGEMCESDLATKSDTEVDQAGKAMKGGSSQV